MAYRTISSAEQGFPITLFFNFVAFNDNNEEYGTSWIYQTQDTSVMADDYEPDDTPEQASYIGIGVIVLGGTFDGGTFDVPQRHTLHKSGDEDWVKFYDSSLVDSIGPYTLKVANVDTRADRILELYDDTNSIYKTNGTIRKRSGASPAGNGSLRHYKFVL